MADTANLFTTGRRSQEGSPTSDTGPAFTRVEKEELEGDRQYGRLRPVRKGAYGHDVVTGLSETLSWTVTSNRVMDRKTAGTWLLKIQRRHGIEREKEGVVQAWCDALWACHTLNSASVLTPDRAVFSVEGSEFSYADVIEVLGRDARRFFRAYADDIRMVNLRILHDIGDDNEELRSRLLWAARDRGLAAKPELAHDSSDACTELSVADHALLRRAKVSLLAQTTNVADLVRVMRTGGGDSGGTGDLAAPFNGNPSARAAAAGGFA